MADQILEQILEQLPQILMGAYLLYKKIDNTPSNDSVIEELKEEVEKLKNEISFLKGKLSK